MDRLETVDHLDEVSKTLFLNIKYNNTSPNKAVHKAFMSFAWQECDGSYLQALKKLIENYALDYKYESLFLQIEDLKSSIIGLSTKLEPIEKKKEPKFFGEK